MKKYAGTTSFIVAVLLVSSVAVHAADKKEKPSRKRPPDIRLKVGQAAPDFAIYRLDDAMKMEEEKLNSTGSGDADKKPDKKIPKKIRLYDFRGKKPVFLIFSSYT